MTHPGRVPYRVEFAEPANAFLRRLTPRRYGQAMTVVHGILEEPRPDGRTRIRLPFPYRFGSIGCMAGGFFVVYVIEEPSTVVVLNVARAAPSFYG